MNSNVKISEKDLFNYVFDQSKLDLVKVNFIKNNLCEFDERIKYFEDLFNDFGSDDQLLGSFINRNDNSEFIVS